MTALAAARCFGSHCPLWIGSATVIPARGIIGNLMQSGWIRSYSDKKATHYQ